VGRGGRFVDADNAWWSYGTAWVPIMFRVRVRSETVPLYRRVYKADVAMTPIAQPTKLVSVNGIHVRVQDLTKKSKELWAATVLWSQAE
jgi:hypothetical protein